MEKTLVSNSRDAITQMKWDFEYKDFLDKFETAPSRELDLHFYKELKPLVKSLANLDKEKREILAFAISSLIDIYMSNKVERELEHLFKNLIK